MAPDKLINSLSEAAFAKRVHNGDDILSDIVRVLSPKLEPLVDRYVDQGMDRIDLQQEAWIAIARAVQAFPWRERDGFEDAALAHVTEHLDAAIAHAQAPLLIPGPFVDMAERLLDATKTLVEELGREPTQEEIAQRMGCSVDEMRAALSMKAEKGEFVVLPVRMDPLSSEE
jgi:RNA polymerase primary sigma factor